MNSSLAAPRFSPELRAAIFHFSVFGTGGVASVYFGIWLSLKGISADETGLINAAPVLAVLGVNVLVGRIADRARDWRQVIIALALIAGTVPLGLFFVSGFWSILLLWTLATVPMFSLVPVIDAATLRMTERRGTDFGTVRAWGTVGFMVTTALSGPAIGFLGDGAFVPLFLAFAVLRAVLSLQLPQFRPPVAERKPVVAPRKLRDALKPWFILTVVGFSILYSTHGVLGAFAALLWKDQGISEGLIGPLIAVMAAAEALMMFAWTKLKLKFSARHIIIFACVVAAFRWTAMAFSPPVWVLFLLQTLHAVTFAMGYLGGIYFIANWTDENIAAEAQGFSYVVQQGMSVLVLVGMGWCFGAFGPWAWLVLAAYSLLGAGLVYLSLRLQPRSTRQPAEPVTPPVPATGEILP